MELLVFLFLIKERSDVCNDCKKRSTCTAICFEIENTQLKFGHSLKSNYFIKFVDPFIIEEIHCSNENKQYEDKISKMYLKYLNDGLNKLNKNQKISIMYYYGLKDGELHSQTNIAKILHVSQNTVKYYLNKARNALKTFISSSIAK